MKKLKLKVLKFIMRLLSEHEIKREILNIYKKDVELYNKIIHVKKGKIKYQLLIIKPKNDTRSIYHLRRHHQSDMILENPPEMDIVRQNFIYKNNK